MLSGDSSTDMLQPKTIEIWVKRIDNSPFYIDGRDSATDAISPIFTIGASNGTTRATMYRNGLPLASFTPVPPGEWSVIHLVSTDPNYLVGKLYLNIAQWGFGAGQTTADIQIGQVVLYAGAKTADEVADIYAAYVGLSKSPAIDTSVITITEPAVSAAIYDYDWSISASG